MTYIEKLARIAAEKYAIEYVQYGTPSTYKATWYATIRSILTAMLEPSERMVNAGWAAMPGDQVNERSEPCGPPEPVWQAMIQAALSEDDA